MKLAQQARSEEWRWRGACVVRFLPSRRTECAKRMYESIYGIILKSVVHSAVINPLKHLMPSLQLSYPYDDDGC